MISRIRNLSYRSPLTAPQPPPASTPSATVFAAKVFVMALAILFAIALFVTAAHWVTEQVRVVLFGSALGMTLLVARTRRGDSSEERDSPPGDRATAMTAETPFLPPAIGVSKRAMVVGVSVAFVVLAFLVPQNVGAVFAALGLTGLFAVRVSLM